MSRAFVMGCAFALLLDSTAHAEEPANIARDILHIEQELLSYPPHVYARMHETVDGGVMAVTRTGLVTGTPNEIDRASALRILATIDGELVSRNFIYPGVGLMDYLSDGLIPTKLSPAQFQDAIGKFHNARRRSKMEANRHGDFFIVDCDTASFLFLAVAERLRLPLYLVEVPRHNFVRWEFADGTHLNFETMDGIELSDADYRQGWGVSDDTIEAGFFMTAMKREEVLGYVTAVRGSGWERKKEIEKARADYRTSGMLRPKSPVARNALAWSYATCETAACRDGATAVKLATEAVSMWRIGDFLDTLACAYGAVGNFEEAVRQEREALRIGYSPSFEYNLGRLEKGELCPFEAPSGSFSATTMSLQAPTSLLHMQMGILGKFAGND